ncbi:PTS lactose/cellobiose transporter subunit IIA [Oceanobacillus indicireducens]|uniref:PTS mannose transporter subunit IIA n=1 Tax=Oceanobacillus indicireducens TaxID=1004261 RepID=A0A917XW79_9BACI|nr:PTS lactose/cellobiose transporter subunit IIA [Oceanobacillus indicireducens]GGN55206.1 PTS mannose transporter subunit IIA [Oceanobacillus indicireducens]
MNIDNLSMQIILYAGNAKNALHEALQQARIGDFSHTQNRLEEASKELLQAHKIQTRFIQEEAKENLGGLSILLVHAQDHLMTVMSEKELIEEMIHLYGNQHRLERRVEEWIRAGKD